MSIIVLDCITPKDLLISLHKFQQSIAFFKFTEHTTPKRPISMRSKTSTNKSSTDTEQIQNT